MVLHNRIAASPISVALFLSITSSSLKNQRKKYSINPDAVANYSRPFNPKGLFEGAAVTIKRAKSATLI
jgi:hypothetical protein